MSSTKSWHERQHDKKKAELKTIAEKIIGELEAMKGKLAVRKKHGTSRHGKV